MSFAIFRNMLLLMSLFLVGEVMAEFAYDFKFNKIGTDEELKLSEYKGKIIMVVNVASKCGFTKQYEALENLYNEYKDKGFVVLGVPANDFGSQEPGSDQEIMEFVSSKYNVSFPIASKEVVKGDNAHPFYKWVKAQRDVAPKWNFYKIVIGKNGEILDYFSSMTKPDSKKILKILEEELGE